MRFVLLGHMDPNDEGFWSGTPMQIVMALRAAGHDVATIGPLEPNVTLWGRVKGRWHRHVFGRTYTINRDPALFKARATQANNLLRDHATADAVIVPYPPDAAYLQCPVPLIVIHDATWSQLLDFYPGYERRNLARETLEGGLELDRRALANCDRVIYSSRWAAKSAIDDYGIAPSKVCVIPLGAGLTAEPSREDVGRWLEHRREGPCRLLFVGIDWHRKGGEVAVAAAQRLHSEGMPIELQVVGCMPPAGLPPFVRCFGFLSKKDAAQALQIHKLYQQASFFIMPTRADCFGVALCEAAAYGLPVLTTNVGGIPEILGGCEWGAMFAPSAPPQAFASFIQASYAHPEVYERMSWAARRDFEDRLNWTAFCQALTGIVESLAGNNAHCPPPAKSRNAGARAQRSSA